METLTNESRKHKRKHYASYTENKYTPRTHHNQNNTNSTIFDQIDSQYNPYTTVRNYAQSAVKPHQLQSDRSAHGLSDQFHSANRNKINDLYQTL